MKRGREDEDESLAVNEESIPVSLMSSMLTAASCLNASNDCPQLLRGNKDRDCRLRSAS